MSENLVSIIMNCYNGEKYLKYSINSVLNQTYDNWELIFWDNQSTDSSAEIFNSFVDKRLKYYYSLEHDNIVSRARNKAIEKATGEFVAFLDVDDLWLPEKLSEQLNVFSQQDIGVICGNYWVMNERKNTKSLALKRSFDKNIATNDLLKNYFVSLVTLIIRRKALDRLSYFFNEDYHIIGDFDLVIRLSLITKLAVVQSPIAILRLHSSNETNKNLELHWKEISLWIKFSENIQSISSLDGFKYRKDWYVYTMALFKIIDNNKKFAFRVFIGLPWGALKLKLLAALLMPISIVKAIKN